MDKPIWIKSTPEQKSILITLLLMANHEISEWEWMGEKFNVEPGQFVTSIESIRMQSGKGISIQNIRGALVRFEKLEFLTNKATKTGRLITIVNWDSYQLKETKPTKKPTKTQQRPNKDPTPNKNIYTKIYQSYHSNIEEAKEKLANGKTSKEMVDMYVGFVNFLFGKTKDNNTRFDLCLSLRGQIDFGNFITLIENFDKGLIKAKVRAMEDYGKTLVKKDRTFYFNLYNWCKKDDSKGI